MILALLRRCCRRSLGKSGARDGDGLYGEGGLHCWRGLRGAVDWGHLAAEREQAADRAPAGRFRAAPRLLGLLDKSLRATRVEAELVVFGRGRPVSQDGNIVTRNALDLAESLLRAMPPLGASERW